MNFFDFQATGRNVEDATTIEQLELQGVTGPVRVYGDNLYLEAASPRFEIWYLTLGSDASGPYYGLTGREQAEAKLYEWAISEGYES